MATLPQKFGLLKGVLSHGKPFTGPLYASVNITDRCNLNCLCCQFQSPLIENATARKSKQSDIPLSFIQPLFNDFRDLGTKLVIFEGEGEPLLHDQVFQIIGWANQAGLKTMMFTNGTLLNGSRIARLIESGLDVLKVSLWGSNREEYEKNHPGTDPELFDSILANIKTVDEMRRKENRHSQLPVLELAYSINTFNCASVEDLANLVRIHGFDRIQFSAFNPKDEQFKHLGLSEVQEHRLYGSLKRLKRSLKDNRIDHNIDDILKRYHLARNEANTLPCYIGWYFTKIKTDGQVMGCNPLKMAVGNLNDQDFRSIWLGSDYRRFRLHILRRRWLDDDIRRLNCHYCCHIGNNARIDHVLRWVRPFRK